MQCFKVLESLSRQKSLYNKIASKLCKEYGIIQTSFDIIMFLHNNPSYNTAKEICEIRGIKSGIVSVEVEKLVKNGLMRKSIDVNDRRKQRLFLTEKTNHITKIGSKMQNQFWNDLTEDFTDEELAIYETLFNKLTSAVAKIEKTIEV